MFEQLDNHRLVGFFLGIERDRFLVAVERGENRPEIAGWTVTGMAHHVARKLAAVIFHLDDFRAHVGKIQGRKRPQNDSGHVQYLQAL